MIAWQPHSDDKEFPCLYSKLSSPAAGSKVHTERTDVTYGSLRKEVDECESHNVE